MSCSAKTTHRIHTIDFIILRSCSPSFLSQWKLIVLISLPKCPGSNGTVPHLSKKSDSKHSHTALLLSLQMTHIE